MMILTPALNKLSPYLSDRGFKKDLPLPPYSSEAALLLDHGRHPKNDIFLFVGIDSWKEAKAFRETQIVMCLPYNRDPFDFFWPVKDFPILMFDTGLMNIIDIEKIACALLNAEAEIVRVTLHTNRLVIYRRGGTC